MPNRIIILCLLLISAPGLAFAHAAMVKASPGARAALRQMPARIELCFNEAVELKFSAIKITDASNAALALGELVIGATPKCLAAAIPPSGEGVYTVEFRVLSLDGHVVKNSYQFTIKPEPKPN